MSASVGQLENYAPERLEHHLRWRRGVDHNPSDKNATSRTAHSDPQVPDELMLEWRLTAGIA